MNVVNFIWWLGFIFCALIAQKLFTGFDFLIVGFIVLLQEEDLKQLALLTPILLLIQESISTFAFGSVLLWYVIAIALTFIAKWLFQSISFFFILTFSTLLSFSQIGIYLLMMSLEGIHVQNSEHYIQMRIIQALIIAITWKIAILTRPKAIEATFNKA